jgi:two-component system LytT family response regulator
VAAEVGAQHLPPTIFVTAYQEHAVQAFEFAAVDYLTKPVTRDRLAKAVERVRSLQAAAAAVSMQDRLTTLLARIELSTVAPGASQRFLVKDGDKDLIIPASEVEWIEADDYYSRLHVSGKAFMLRESMAELSQHLDARLFVRVHRSAIVNLDHVKALFRDGREEGMLQMRNDARVRTSKVGRLRLSAMLALSPNETRG